MFLGHFGVGFGAKAITPRASLGTLFLAAQFLDLLWPTLLLLDLEQVRIVVGATRVTPLVFEYYPISHSLVAAIAWAFLVGGGYLYWRRSRVGALVVGGLVVSHWFLDVIVHRPDLPLFPGSATMVGLDAWSSLPLTLAIEGAIFAVGVAWYLRVTRPIDMIGRWGLVALVTFLLVVYAADLFGGAPPSAKAIAWAGELQWLLVIWGYWVDRHRRTLGIRR